MLAASSPALAQSLDETINQGFANATGWFVSLIFSKPRNAICDWQTEQPY